MEGNAKEPQKHNSRMYIFSEKESPVMVEEKIETDAVFRDGERYLLVFVPAGSGVANMTKATLDLDLDEPENLSLEPNKHISEEYPKHQEWEDFLLKNSDSNKNMFLYEYVVERKDPDQRVLPTLKVTIEKKGSVSDRTIDFPVMDIVNSEPILEKPDSMSDEDVWKDAKVSLKIESFWCHNDKRDNRKKVFDLQSCHSLDLSMSRPSLSRRIPENIQSFREDMYYGLNLTVDGPDRDSDYDVDFYINGFEYANAVLRSTNDNADLVYNGTDNQDDPKKFKTMVFHFVYEFAYLTVRVSRPGYEPLEFWSDIVQVEPKNPREKDTYGAIFSSLLGVESPIDDDTDGDRRGGLTRSSWKKSVSRTLDAYMDILENTEAFFSGKKAWFASHGALTVKKTPVIVSGNNVRTVGRKSVEWLMHNPQMLAGCSAASGIKVNGKNYYPYRVLSSSLRKSRDTLENRCLISYLNDVVKVASVVERKMRSADRNELQTAIQPRGKHGRRPAVVEMSSMVRSFYDRYHSRHQELLRKLESLKRSYVEMFPMKVETMAQVPRLTSCFKEVPEYRSAYELMVKWMVTGNAMNTFEDRFASLVNVKSADVVYEYYCLLRLLKIFRRNKFRPVEAKCFVYEKNLPPNYSQDRTIANTYHFKRENGDEAFLYYEPVISHDPENDINLRYENDDRAVTPDFMIRFRLGGQYKWRCVILDSKLGNPEHMKDTMKRLKSPYFYNLRIVNKKIQSEKLNLLVILQGRGNVNQAVGPWHGLDSVVDEGQSVTPAIFIMNENEYPEIEDDILWDEIMTKVHPKGANYKECEQSRG